MDAPGLGHCLLTGKRGAGLIQSAPLSAFCFLRQPQHADARIGSGSTRTSGHQGFAFLTYNTTNADNSLNAIRVVMDIVHDIFRTGFIVQVEIHNLPNPRDGGKFIRLVQSELRTLNLDMAKRVQSLSNPCFCQAYRNCKTRALAIVPKRSNRPKVRYEGSLSTTS